MAVNLVQSIQRIAAAVLENDRPMCIRCATVECEEDTRGSDVVIRISPQVALAGFGAAPLLNGGAYKTRLFDGGEKLTLLQDRGGQRFWILEVS